MATFKDFEKLDIRVGKIVEADSFPEAKTPAYKLTIDFGEEMGIKRSSAQITKHYSREKLIGKKVLAVVNFPPKQIGNFVSDVLVLGVPDDEGEVVLVVPENDKSRIGGKLY